MGFNRFLLIENMNVAKQKTLLFYCIPKMQNIVWSPQVDPFTHCCYYEQIKVQSPLDNIVPLQKQQVVNYGNRVIGLMMPLLMFTLVLIYTTWRKLPHSLLVSGDTFWPWLGMDTNADVCGHSVWEAKGTFLNNSLVSTN